MATGSTTRQRAGRRAISSAQPSSSAAPMPKTARRIDRSLRKLMCKPGRKQQQDDPEFGERLDRVGIADREGVKPGMGRSEGAERVRARDDPDQDEADDRADPEPGKSRNDDPRRAEDRQRIAEARCRLLYSSPCSIRAGLASHCCHAGCAHARQPSSDAAKQRAVRATS